MMRYLLDTNALIEFLRDEQSSIAVRMGLHQADEIGIPIICLHELYFGAYKGSQRERSLAAIEGLEMPVVSFEREDARVAGEIRAGLQRAGRSIGSNDLLIAGQAKARGLVLVTHNVREFVRVEGLVVEDWQGS